LLNITQSYGQDPEASYSKFSILYEKAGEGSGGPPPAGDLFKYRIFLAKLLPKIRSDITRMGTLPAKLPDLISTAQRLYQTDKQERRMEKKAENESNNRSGCQGQIGTKKVPTRSRLGSENIDQIIMTGINLRRSRNHPQRLKISRW